MAVDAAQDGPPATPVAVEAEVLCSGGMADEMFDFPSRIYPLRAAACGAMPLKWPSFPPDVCFPGLLMLGLVRLDTLCSASECYSSFFSSSGITPLPSVRKKPFYACSTGTVSGGEDCAEL